MSSIQERLQLKRVPLDTWSIREQLCLASAVVRSGDQNWMSVSRILKTIAEPNRPPDWYSQKSCAAQYGSLLEHVETPKRKKRNSEGAVESPQESIVKRLTQDRIAELQKSVADMTQEYEQIKTELTEIRDPATPEDRIKELLDSMEASKRAKEREAAQRAAWLKEREEKRARADRTWRPPQESTPSSPVSTATPAPPASPLLTSLLKSSPVVTTPQHISHPANMVDTVSPSVTAPTLSMLLEKASVGTSAHESKHAAIEHIKNQLQQIEDEFKANTSSTPLPTPVQPVAQPVPAVDIDDIEIKAEDVYAFRDIDIHIPPVGEMHKGNNRVPEKIQPKKDDVEPPVDVVSEENITVPPEEVDVQEEPMEVDPGVSKEVETETPHEEPVVDIPPSSPPKEVQENEVKVSFPEVKFPTTEIKVIQPDEQKQNKEDSKEPETEITEAEIKEELKREAEEESVGEEIKPEAKEESKLNEEEKEIAPQQTETEKHEDDTVESSTTLEEVVDEVPLPLPENIPLPPDPSDAEDGEETPAPEPPLPQELEPSPPEEDAGKEEVGVDDAQEPAAEELVVKQEVEEVKKDEDSEDGIPLKQMIKKEDRNLTEKVVEETHTETDDDTPMELSREEEKDGKKKRDYSRKKKSESRTWSGSESAAEASAPESPGGGSSTSEADKHHRLWKKSVMLVYSRLCAHKYASLFVRPISDEEAPGYSVVVKRPMDFSTIRRNIDNGVVRTTAEFQRDVLLMLSNALMYNSSEHSVYTMAKEMHEEAQCQLGMLLAAQAHAGLSSAPARRKRKRH